MKGSISGDPPPPWDRRWVWLGVSLPPENAIAKATEIFKSGADHPLSSRLTHPDRLGP